MERYIRVRSLSIITLLRAFALRKIKSQDAHIVSVLRHKAHPRQ